MLLVLADVFGIRSYFLAVLVLDVFLVLADLAGLFLQKLDTFRGGSPRSRRPYWRRLSAEAFRPVRVGRSGLAHRGRLLSRMHKASRKHSGFKPTESPHGMRERGERLASALPDEHPLGLVPQTFL